jgi:hypothetical protein
MKKHILKKLLIFGMVIVLFGCSEELFEDAIDLSNKRTIKEVKFNELYKDKKFKNLLEKVSRTSNAARTSFENQNGFTISDGFVKVIETDSLLSYTMFIERDNVVDTLSFENLIIQKNKYTNIEKAVTIKYTPTLISASADASFYFEGTAQLKNLAFTGFNRFGSFESTTQGDCYKTVVQIWCRQPFLKGGPDHLAGSACSPDTMYPKVVSIYTPENCDDKSGGGGGNGPSDGNNGPGNTGGGPGGGTGGGVGGTGSNIADPANSESQTVTSPVNPSYDFGGGDEMDTPCKQLSAMSSTLKSNVKTKLNDLAPFTNQNSVEYSFAIELINKADGTKEFIADDISYSGTMGGPQDTGPTVIGNGHNHPNNSHSMFSFTDICLILDIYKKAKESKKEFVFIYIVVKDTETGAIFPYALKIDNFYALTDKINETLSQSVLASKSYDEKLKALDVELGFKYDNNPTALEKVFLEEYKLFGISLYKSDNLELNNWKKLELKTDGTVEEVPCNN